MDRPQLRSWLNHPVCREFVDLLVEHRDNLQQVLVNSPIEQATVGELNKLKGRIEELNDLIDLESFLEEKLTREKVKEDDEDA